MKRFIVISIVMAILVTLIVAFFVSRSAQSTPTTHLSAAELKGKLLEYFGSTPQSFPGSEGISYCDWYMGYVIDMHEQEKKDALRYWTDITKNTDAYQVILKRLDLQTRTSFTDVEKLKVFRECRKLSGAQLDLRTDPPNFNLQITNNSPKRREYNAKGTITWQGDIKILSEQNTGPLRCPICLIEGTMIDTPDGARTVELLTEGMTVWTIGYDGQRIAAKISRVAKYPTSPEHQVVEVKLADGRTITASLGHPLTDGMLIGDVKVGDTVDGSQATEVTIKPYAGNYTYDILPENATGFYWANGILLGSTLKIICN
jgi:hypothetical protein